ncbi:MAG: hypothetical protein ACI8RZ_001015 [Myxococcota bacterium]|jgi:hypothetical protein
MRTIITALTATIAVAGLIGCEKESGCTDHLAWSVQLLLEDESGARVDGAVVSVTDGTITEDCEGYEGVYACGAEMSGDLTISIQASGFSSEEIDVTIASDECHVLPEEITHTLMSVDCAQEAVPSVVVSVSNEAGDPITDVDVGYVSSNDKVGAESIDCEAGDGAFYCGEEVAGDLEIYASAKGYVPHSEVVTVEMSSDGCHVVTEDLDVVLLAE